MDTAQHNKQTNNIDVGAGGEEEEAEHRTVCRLGAMFATGGRPYRLSSII